MNKYQEREDWKLTTEQYKRTENNNTARQAIYVSVGVHVTTAAVEKHSECTSVALVIYDAKRMHCIILSGMACLSHHIFTHYLTRGTIFVRQVFEHKICFDFPNKSCLKQFSFQEEFC